MKTRLPGAILVATLLVSHAAGQLAAARDTFAAMKFVRASGKQPAAWFVEYVPYGKEEAFRIRAHHYHGWCNGYLYFTPTGVAYVPEFTPARKDGLFVKRTDIQALRARFSGYEFQVGDKLYRFAFLADPDESPPGAQDGRIQLMKFVEMALSDFAAAKEQFLSVLTGVPPGPATSSATVLALPPAPVLRVLDPPGAADNVTTDASGAVQRVFGVAAAGGGIRAITVNDAPALTTPLSPEVVLFQSNGLLLNPGANSFRIAAKSNDGAEASMAFAAVKPEVRLEPLPGTKTADEKIDVKGVASGMRDLRNVGINGKLVPVRQRPDGGFDFGLQNVPLSMGRNTITVFTVESNGRRNIYDTIVMRVAPRSALSYAQIAGGLQNHVPNSILQQQVEERGVDFELTPELEKKLRRLGASEALLNAINDGLR